MYTNTSNPKAIVGLLLVTVGVAYCTTHATEIVEGSFAKAKEVAEKLNALAHHGKKQYRVVERTYDGTLRDTGKNIWR